VYLGDGGVGVEDALAQASFFIIHAGFFIHIQSFRSRLSPLFVSYMLLYLLVLSGELVHYSYTAPSKSLESAVCRMWVYIGVRYT
jgi:hypothetical protein